MPGVPYEMKTMMNNFVFDKLNKRSNNFALVHKTITVVGIPESHLSAAIENIENSLPSHIALAYLPHLNIIRLRLSGKSTDLDNDTLEDQIDNYFSEIKEIIGNVWFDGEFQLSEVIGAMLKKNNLTIGTIESCSGGYLAHQLTAIKGSSAYFKGSLLTYAYETKVEVADIDQEMLDTYGAVSEQVAKSMAVNARKKLGVDYCISTTGIAGPGGGTASKPIGLVYIGLAAPDGTVSVKKCQFSGTRLQVIERTAITAFEMQRQHMLAALQVTST